MAITDVHKEYEDNLEAWTADEDFFLGDIQVKSKGVLYLPLISVDQTDPEYAAYNAMGLYPGAVGRTVRGLTGSAMLKEPEINLTGRMEGFITTQKVKATVQEEIKIGRDGLLVDMPELTFPATVQNVVCNRYDAFQITDWEHDKKGKLIRVVLKESRPGKDENDSRIEICVYRELLLSRSFDEATNRTIDTYIIKLWEERTISDKTEWTVIETITPTTGTASLTFIPFIFINPIAVSSKIEVSPMQDMTAVAKSQYQTIADWKHGLRFTALPTPTATGVDKENANVVKLGSGTALVSSNENAKFGMLEFTGKGLVEVVTAINMFSDWMVFLGARLFQDPKKGVESEETTRLKQGAENATLSSIVDSTESGYRLAIEYANVFLGTSVKPETAFSMSRDFIDSKMSPEALAALMTDWVEGGMSWKTYYYLKKQGELTRPGITEEQEREEIEKEKATMPGFNNIDNP